MKADTAGYDFPPYLPGGGPRYWRDEQTGRLGSAITAYFDNRIQTRPISPADCALVAAYCRYWINAPRWDQNPHQDEEGRARLAALRESAKYLTHAGTIAKWTRRAIALGMDPF